MGTIVKKHKIAPFLNSAVGPDGLVNTASPTWTRICKTASFDLQMNPQTEEYDYICDESPTTELMKYAPSFNTPLVMHKGEPDYEFIFDKFYNLKTGSEAKSEILMVYFQEPLDTADTHVVFKAQKASCVISVNDLNSVDQTLSFDVLFGGTTAVGYVTVTNGVPAFTEGEYTE